MQRVKFWSWLGKLSIVCNAFFVLAFVLRYYRFTEQHDVETVIVILGWLVSPILNVSLLLLYFLRCANRLPKWILFTNFIMLFIQLTLYLTHR